MSHIIKEYKIGEDSRGIFKGAYIYTSTRPADPFSRNRKETPCLKVWIQLAHCAGSILCFDQEESIINIETALIEYLDKWIASEFFDEDGEEEYPKAAAQVARLEEQNKAEARILKNIIEQKHEKQPELFGVTA